MRMWLALLLLAVLPGCLGGHLKDTTTTVYPDGRQVTTVRDFGYLRSWMTANAETINATLDENGTLVLNVNGWDSKVDPMVAQLATLLVQMGYQAGAAGVPLKLSNSPGSARLSPLSGPVRFPVSPEKAGPPPAVLPVKQE